MNAIVRRRRGRAYFRIVPCEQAAVRAAGRLPLVLGRSEAVDELDAPFLGIAAELALAGVSRFRVRQASRRLPFALPKEKWSTSVTQPRHGDGAALLPGE